MSNTTTYTIIAAGEARGTKSKKATAVELAVSIRNDEHVDVAVVTGAGTEVFALAAPKKIKMSAPYTRVVPVDAENVEMINGQRVAYKRTRVGFALLDAGKGEYTIWDLVNKCAVEGQVPATTREAGRFFADEARDLRASLEAANA